MISGKERVRHLKKEITQRHGGTKKDDYIGRILTIF